MTVEDTRPGRLVTKTKKKKRAAVEPYEIEDRRVTV